MNRVVYHALQHSQDDTTIAHLDKEVADLRESVAALRMDQRALSSRLASVSCPLPTRELQPMVESLEGERTMLRDRLTWLSVEDFTSLLPEQRADVNRQWSIWSRKAAARKAMALELWRIVTELLPEGRSRDTLWVRLSSPTQKQLCHDRSAKFLLRKSLTRCRAAKGWRCRVMRRARKG